MSLVWDFYRLAPSLLGAPAAAPTEGPDVPSRVYVAPIPIGESNAVSKEYHYLRRGRTSAQIAYGVWYRGIGVGVIHFAYARWSRSPYPEAPSPMNVLECARVYISNVDRKGYPIGNAKGRRIEGLAVAAFKVACERVKVDWQEKYPHLPRVTALVSWSDNTRHPGRLYGLAGWRLDTDDVKGHSRGSNWYHMVGDEKQPVTQKMHTDYGNGKSRWSLILDDYFLLNPVAVEPKVR